MKHLIKSNKIIQSGIPSVFTRKDGQLFYGGYENMTDLHYEDGWRDEVIPDCDEILECIDFDHPYFSENLDAVTFNVLPLSNLPTIEQAKINKILEVKTTARIKLSDTDWYVIRKAEKSKNIPDEVTTERDLIRSKSDAMELEINNLNILREVLVYQIIF